MVQYNQHQCVTSKEISKKFKKPFFQNAAHFERQMRLIFRRTCLVIYMVMWLDLFDLLVFVAIVAISIEMINFVLKKIRLIQIVGPSEEILKTHALCQDRMDMFQTPPCTFI